MKTLSEQATKIVPSIFKKQLDATKHITGITNTFTHLDRDQLKQVIPVPSIALQWLINSNGWPLGCMTSCTGEPRTVKETPTTTSDRCQSMNGDRYVPYPRAHKPVLFHVLFHLNGNDLTLWYR